MPFDTRHSFITELVEGRLAVCLIEREQTPLLRVGVVSGFDIAVEPNLQVGFAGTDRRSHIDPFSPDNGRRMAQAGNARSPADALALFNVPPHRSDGVGFEPTGLGAPELRPVGSGGGDARGKSGGDNQ